MLERREQPGLPGHGGARGAGPADDVGILRRDPVHEVDPLEQLVEAVGLEDHRDQVGRGLLVVRHQVLRQRLGGSLELVLEVDQVIARREQLALHRAELVLAPRQRVLERGQALVGVGQAVGCLADLGAVGGDLRAERRGRRLAGGDLALKVSRAAAGQPGTEHRRGRDEEGDDPGGSAAFVGEGDADASGHGKVERAPNASGTAVSVKSPLDGSRQQPSKPRRHGGVRSCPCNKSCKSPGLGEFVVFPTLADALSSSVRKTAQEGVFRRTRRGGHAE